MDNVCQDCGQALKTGLFGKETRVLGSAYCADCVEARTLFCHSCRTPIRKADFDEGRAVTLLGRRYCQDCLESAVKEGRNQAGTKREPAPTAPALVKADDPNDPQSVAVRRAYGRYVPPGDTELVARGSGLLNVLRGNRVRLWLDVSEGGFRAILSGAFAVDELLSGSVSERGTKRSFAFQASVRHSRPAPRHPGCVLVGARFERPSADLQAFIKSKMSGRPAMIPSTPQKPASA